MQQQQRAAGHLLEQHSLLQMPGYLKGSTVVDAGSLMGVQHRAYYKLAQELHFSTPVHPQPMERCHIY